MAGQWNEVEGILLGVTPHERFTRWEVFSSESGIRGVQVPIKKALPFGLFDTVAVCGSLKGKAIFAEDLKLIERPAGLAQYPKSFERAGELARLVIDLFRDLPDYSAVYDIFSKSLGYYAQGLPPMLVSLKALYKILSSEGFPVGADWLAKLPSDLRASTLAALEAELTATATEPSAEIWAALVSWSQNELGTKRAF